jgi:hypothetical protein
LIATVNVVDAIDETVTISPATVPLTTTAVGAAENPWVIGLPSVLDAVAPYRGMAAEPLPDPTDSSPTVG